MPSNRRHLTLIFICVSSLGALSPSAAPADGGWAEGADCLRCLLTDCCVQHLLHLNALLERSTKHRVSYRKSCFYCFIMYVRRLGWGIVGAGLSFMCN